MQSERLRGAQYLNTFYDSGAWSSRAFFLGIRAYDNDSCAVLGAYFVLVVRS
jgi:hypothetical protein